MQQLMKAHGTLFQWYTAEQDIEITNAHDNLCCIGNISFHFTKQMWKGLLKPETFGLLIFPSVWLANSTIEA